MHHLTNTRPWPIHASSSAVIEAFKKLSYAQSMRLTYTKRHKAIGDWFEEFFAEDYEYLDEPANGNCTFLALAWLLKRDKFAWKEVKDKVVEAYSKLKKKLKERLSPFRLGYSLEEHRSLIISGCWSGVLEVATAAELYEREIHVVMFGETEAEPAFQFGTDYGG